jgi:cytochrome P450
MLPPFHGERMRAHQELMYGAAERSIASWPKGSPFAVAPFMRAMALDVIVRVVLGIDEADRSSRLVASLQRLLDVSSSPWRFFGLLLLDPNRFVMRMWSEHAPLLKRLNLLLLDYIARRRRDPDLPDRTDVLSELLLAHDEDGLPLSDQHLRDELVTLLVAGHETTATSLAWALERIARNPHVYDRLADERAPDAGAFLDATIKETLRQRPIVPFVVRQLAAPVELGDYRLPAGVILAPCVQLLHRRPEIFPDPDIFRPERFIERSPGAYTWLPFGGGTRRCLGASFAMQEMRTVLRAVTRAGRPLACDAREEPIGRRGITLAPARGGRIIFQPHSARCRVEPTAR